MVAHAQNSPDGDEGNGKGKQGLRKPPIDYLEEILERICHGETLRAICNELRSVGGPPAPTVRLWVLNDSPPGTAARYARARELQVESWADEIQEIADDGTNDWMDKEVRGGTIRVVDREAIERSRLRVDTRKWIMSKIAPKKYGELKPTPDDAQAPLLITLDTPIPTIRQERRVGPGQ